MKYTLLDQYGTVKGRGDVPEAFLSLNVPAGHRSVPEHPPNDNCYHNGTTWVDRPARPSPYHTWDGPTLAWIETRTLEQVKAAKWAELKAARDAFEFGGFLWSGYAFDSDAMSQSRLQGAVQLAALSMGSGETFSVDWTLKDNSVVTLNAASMIAVGIALAQHVITAHTISRSLRMVLENTATLEQVHAVAWPPA